MSIHSKVTALNAMNHVNHAEDRILAICVYQLDAEIAILCLVSAMNAILVLLANHNNVAARMGIM